MQSKEKSYEDILKKAATNIVCGICQLEQPNKQGIQESVRALISTIEPVVGVSVIEAARCVTDVCAKFDKVTKALKYPDGISPDTEGFLSVPRVREFVDTVLQETNVRQYIISHGPKALKEDSSDTNSYDSEITGRLAVAHDLMSYIYDIVNGLAFIVS